MLDNGWDHEMATSGVTKNPFIALGNASR